MTEAEHPTAMALAEQRLNELLADYWHLLADHEPEEAAEVAALRLRNRLDLPAQLAFVAAAAARRLHEREQA